MYPEVSDQEKVIRALKGLQFVRDLHGSLFDRGSADSYYGRGPHKPHYGGVLGSVLPRTFDLTPEERDEYLAGYYYNEQYGSKKDWD